jgi:CubicO group peptidase (beta-lactamase class C family)
MKRLIIFVVSASLLLVAGCSTQPSEDSGPLCQRSSPTLAELPLPADLEAIFDPVAAEGMSAMDAVGMTFAVQCGESPTYVKGYGSADLTAGVAAAADTVYQIGSVSKQFVAAEIIKLAEQQSLSLGDPIGMFLPSLPAEWQVITLDQLLSHTGGVPDHFAIFAVDPETPFDWTRDYTASELVDAFLELDDDLVATPGTQFLYSSTGYAMLTAVIENVTQHSFAEALDRDLLKPLGLEQAAFCSPSLPDMAAGYNIGPDGPIPGLDPPASFLSGAAGICGTAGDLVRWQRQMVEGTAVSAAAFQAMSTPAHLNDGTELPYGLGLHLDELGLGQAIFHEGGTASFSSWLVYYPDTDLIVAVLTNTLGPNSAKIRELVIDLAKLAVL